MHSFVTPSFSVLWSEAKSTEGAERIKKAKECSSVVVADLDLAGNPTFIVRVVSRQRDSENKQSLRDYHARAACCPRVISCSSLVATCLVPLNRLRAAARGCAHCFPSFSCCLQVAYRCGGCWARIRAFLVLMYSSLRHTYPCYALHDDV